MITKQQIDAWRLIEIERTTMPLESELLEAAAWDVVGQLIEEVERQWAIWSSKLLQMHALEEKNDNQAEEIELLKGELESLQAGLGEDTGRDRAEVIIDEAKEGPITKQWRLAGGELTLCNCAGCKKKDREIARLADILGKYGKSPSQWVSEHRRLKREAEKSDTARRRSVKRWSELVQQQGREIAEMEDLFDH